jgi:hypothetical protein
MRLLSPRGPLVQNPIEGSSRDEALQALVLDEEWRARLDRDGVLFQLLDETRVVTEDAQRLWRGGNGGDVLIYNGGKRKFRIYPWYVHPETVLRAHSSNPRLPGAVSMWFRGKHEETQWGCFGLNDVHEKLPDFTDPINRLCLTERQAWYLPGNR